VISNCTCEYNLYLNVELVFESIWSSTINVELSYQYLECAMVLGFCVLFIEELNSLIIDSFDMK